MSKTAEDLMQEPDFVDISATVDEVKKEFEGAENTLIVKDGEDFVGEIHEHTMLKLLIPQKRIDEEKVIGILGLSFDKSYVAETAEDLLKRHEVTVPPEEEVGEIAFLMEKEGVRSVPVEKDGEIVGIIHENDLMEEI